MRTIPSLLPTNYKEQVQYIAACMGELRTDEANVAAICDLCAKYVFVTLETNDASEIEAYCQCKDFWAKGRCEHALAALVLEGLEDIRGMIEKIAGPKKAGRPTKHAPAGEFGSTQVKPNPSQVHLNYQHHLNNAAKYLKETIAKKLSHRSSTKVWLGVVEGGLSLFHKYTCMSS